MSQTALHALCSRVLLFCIGLMILGLVAAPRASASPGTYEIEVPSTHGYPGWWSPHDGGPYRVAGFHVDAGVGGYARGAYRRWRFQVHDPSVRIAGGRISGSASTPNSDFVLQLRQGSSGGAVRNLLSSATASSFDRDLVGGNDWVEFGLLAVRATRVARRGANRITISRLNVVLFDGADPSLVLQQVPDAVRWHGATCQPWALRVTDWGAGISRVNVTSATTGLPVDGFQSPARPGTQPGTAAVERSGCVGPGMLQHGPNDFVVETADASGRGASARFHVKADLRGPAVSGGLEEGTRVTTPRPSATWVVGDADSGVEAVSAAVDGLPTRLDRDLSRYTLVLERNLEVGEHRMVLRATDAVGNVTLHERTFTVGDDTAPSIVVDSPGPRGGSSPWLAAHASDEGSAVDAGSWRVTVNGAPLMVSVAGPTISGQVGELTAGTHLIDLSVADEHGNRASERLVYEVEGHARPSGVLLAVGGRSGLFLQSAPSTPVRFGDEVLVAVGAARLGRPLAGYRMIAQQANSRIASAQSDAHGVAELGFTARRPAVLDISVDGSEFAPLQLRLEVSPRISLGASARRPRRGAPVRISGRIAPAGAVRKVALQARIDGAWYPLRRSVRVDRRGRYEATVSSAVPGEVAVRVMAPARAGWSQGTSNVQVLRIRR